MNPSEQGEREGEAPSGSAGGGGDVSPSNRALQIDQIIQSLHTQYIGKNIIYFQSTDSTNLQASVLGKKGSSNGTLVVTDRQTHGKGRRGRRWISPAFSNLYFSILLRPPIPPQRASWISLISGIALAKGIKASAGLSPKIKWPNDILINDRKLGGILTELHIEGGKISYVVLGIGINVNMTRFPAEIAPIATSLKKELGHPIHREPLLIQLLGEIEKQLESFYQTGSEEIAGEWKRLSDTMEKEVSVTVGDQTMTGKAVDLDPHGGLILERKDGSRLTILTGDVTHLKNINS